MIYSEYITQIQAVVHLELVDSHPKRSEHVPPEAVSQNSVQQLVAAVVAFAQQELNAEGATHPVELKVKSAEIVGREEREERKMRRYGCLKARRLR